MSTATTDFLNLIVFPDITGVYQRDIRLALVAGTGSNMHKIDAGVKAVSDDLSTLDSSLSTVAKSGAYSDLTGVDSVDNAATTTKFGLVKPDGTTVLINAGVISVPVATTSALGLVKPDGTTITVTNAGIIAVPTATASQLGLVKVDNNTVKLSNNALYVPTATSSQLGVVKIDNSSIKINSGVISAQKASSSNFGIVKPDGETVFINDGVISANPAVDIATTESPGIVQPDGETITITEDGIISGAVVGYKLVNAPAWNTEQRVGLVEPDVVLPNIGNPTTTQHFRYIFIAAGDTASFTAPTGVYLSTPEDGYADVDPGNTLEIETIAGYIYEVDFVVLDKTHISMVYREYANSILLVVSFDDDRATITAAETIVTFDDDRVDLTVPSEYIEFNDDRVILTLQEEE